MAVDVDVSNFWRRRCIQTIGCWPRQTTCLQE